MLTPTVPPNRRSRHQRGSTLIEALIAMVLFGIGILGVVTAIGQHNRAGQDARYRSEAAAAVDEYVALIQTAPPLTAPTDYATGGTAFTEWLTDRLRAPGTGLPGADATVNFGAFGGDAQTVEIEVRWTPPRDSVRDGTGAMTAETVTHRYRTLLAITR